MHCSGRVLSRAKKALATNGQPRSDLPVITVPDSLCRSNLEAGQPTYPQGTLKRTSYSKKNCPTLTFSVSSDASALTSVEAQPTDTSIPCGRLHFVSGKAAIDRLISSPASVTPSVSRKRAHEGDARGFELKDTVHHDFTTLHTKPTLPAVTRAGRAQDADVTAGSKRLLSTPILAADGPPKQQSAECRLISTPKCPPQQHAAASGVDSRSLRHEENTHKLCGIVPTHNILLEQPSMHDASYNNASKAAVAGEPASHTSYSRSHRNEADIICQPFSSSAVHCTPQLRHVAWSPSSEITGQQTLLADAAASKHTQGLNDTMPLSARASAPFEHSMGSNAMMAASPIARRLPNSASTAEIHGEASSIRGRACAHALDDYIEADTDYKATDKDLLTAISRLQSLLRARSRDSSSALARAAAELLPQTIVAIAAEDSNTNAALNLCVDSAVKQIECLALECERTSKNIVQSAVATVSKIADTLSVQITRFVEQCTSRRLVSEQAASKFVADEVENSRLSSAGGGTRSLATSVTCLQEIPREERREISEALTKHYIAAHAAAVRDMTLRTKANLDANATELLIIVADAADRIDEVTQQQADAFNALLSAANKSVTGTTDIAAVPSNDGCRVV